MVAWWVYTLVVCPLSFIVGISNLSVAFSAWVSIDTCNSGLSSMYYIRKGKVNYFLAACIGLPSAGMTCFFYATLAQNFLTAYTALLKGGISILTIITAIIFAIKGYIDLRKELKIKEGLIQAELDDRDNVEIIDEYHVELFGGKCIIAGRPEWYWKAWLFYLSAQLIFISQLIAMVTGNVACKSGSGVVYVIVFMVTFFFDVRKSTGSAIIVMFLMMGSLWITMLASTKEIQDDFLDLLPAALIGIIPSACGVFVAAFFYEKIPKSRLLFFVAAILFVVGIIASVQPFIIKLF